MSDLTNAAIEVLIVEDELIIAEDMREMLTELGYAQVHVCKDIAAALTFLANKVPDLALVDVQLGQNQSGISLGYQLRHQYQIPFIYCTSHADSGTVSQASKTQPNGYLVKPFEQGDLYAAIEVALAQPNYQKQTNKPTAGTSNNTQTFNDSLFVKEAGLFYKVRYNEILYLKPDSNYTEIFTSERKFVVRSSLKEFLTGLPAGKFFRAHRSYVVNTEHITAIKYDAICINKQEIPLSKTHREKLLQHLNKVQ